MGKTGTGQFKNRNGKLFDDNRIEEIDIELDDAVLQIWKDIKAALKNSKHGKVLGLD